MCPAYNRRCDNSQSTNPSPYVSQVVSTAVRKAGIAGLFGLEGAVNVQGEDQKKLDIIANENFINTLRSSTKVCLMVSEENDDPVTVATDKSGKYVCVFDPLDGSSNIDCGVSVGSIFGVYERKSPVGECASAADALQPGSELLAAGYTMYGSSTQLVLAMKGGKVQIFTLDPAIGEFIHTGTDVMIPEKPKRIYSVNEGNESLFPDAVRRFIRQCKAASPKPYSLRYVGSMVSDVHRTLLYGGIFMYPSTKSAPAGKLRLLYECNPMSMLMEAAGGRAITAPGRRILDLEPAKIHERAPIFLGCKRDVDIIEALLAEDEGKAGEGAGAATGGASS